MQVVPWPAAAGLLIGGLLYSAGVGLRWLAPGYGMGARLEDRMSPVAPGAPGLTAPGSVAVTAAGLLVLALAWGVMACTKGNGARAGLVVVGSGLAAPAYLVWGLPTGWSAITGEPSRDVLVQMPAVFLAVLPAHLGITQLMVAAGLVYPVRASRVLVAACLVLTTPIVEFTVLNAIWPSHDDPGGTGLLSGLAFVVAGAALAAERLPRARRARRVGAARTDSWPGASDRFRTAGVLLLCGSGLTFFMLALRIASGMEEDDAGWSASALTPSFVHAALMIAVAVAVTSGPWCRARGAAVAAASAVALASVVDVALTALAVLRPGMPGPATGSGWATPWGLESLPGVLQVPGALVLALIAWGHLRDDGPWAAAGRARLMPIAFLFLAAEGLRPLVTATLDSAPSVSPAAVTMADGIGATLLGLLAGTLMVAATGSHAGRVGWAEATPLQRA